MDTNNTKYLTRVRLINWHYFEDECMVMNGSTLVSGENTAGKSTILDAIQFVLTTNSKKFNKAANENGNRNLRGYVRCKIGTVDETYRRKGTVPANVALEFYEAKQDRYFVIGVHLLSQDEESPVKKRWYAEECRLEDLSFIIDGKPALDNEFKNKGRKISYIDSDKAARDRFKHRMGNLDDKFFDIIPKSLAFKPMDNVKDFINQFVLTQSDIDIKELRENIETFNELERILEQTKRKIAGLDHIIEIYHQTEAKNKEITINQILLTLSEKDATNIKINELTKDIFLKKQSIAGISEEIARLEQKKEAVNSKIIALTASINNNEASKLSTAIKQNINEYKRQIAEYQKDTKTLHEKSEDIRAYLKRLRTIDYNISNFAGAERFEKISSKERETIILELKNHFSNSYHEIEMKKNALEQELHRLDDEIEKLLEQQKKLEQHKLIYPDNVEKLKACIEREFQRRGINEKAYILSELLEITDSKWRKAVEGYLNNQKFYLVVNPEVYDIALAEYHKQRERIHSAGIINTKKLVPTEKTEIKSLAYVIKSDNSFAKAYADYVLGRVVRCDSIEELENYDIAITPDCMLYQGYVVRHLNPKHYNTPYIGQAAYSAQLEEVRKKLIEKKKAKKSTKESCRLYEKVSQAKDDVFGGIEMATRCINSPERLDKASKELARAQAELKDAENDPTLIEMNMQLGEATSELKTIEEEIKRNIKLQTRLEEQIDQENEMQKGYTESRERLSAEVTKYKDKGATLFKEADEKYRLNRKTKEPGKIFENFKPRGSLLSRELMEITDQLKDSQFKFNVEFTLDFPIGVSQINEYYSAAEELKKVEAVKREDELRKAKKECEEIFRSDFLSKLRENIESAKGEFRNLNKALENIYYGEDNYHFKITFDKKKENLYRMITSEYNMEGSNNLWTSAFETDYKDEIDDLFAKLMAHDDNGEKVIREYTDYRSYLDYDIEIRKRNGQRQNFSDIYEEKSGSETQVPYYVAIAASFYQLYRYGGSIRIMMLDEAFDKMDDDRIVSMMEFLQSLNFQVILATPPGKIEVIGEHVDTILTAIRVGEGSIVEEYEL